MLRIGKLTDYATVILATLASRPLAPAERRQRWPNARISPRPRSASCSSSCSASGLVNSTRGTHGGYQLARAPEDISAAAILDALEGPLALTECSVGSRPMLHRAQLLRSAAPGSG